MFRRAMWWPPVVSLINVIVRGPSIDAALRDAKVLMRSVDAKNVGNVRNLEHRSDFRVFGPARAPLARLRGEHRAQFFVKGTKRAAMRQAVTDALTRHPEIARRTSVDVDPLSML